MPLVTLGQTQRYTAGDLLGGGCAENAMGSAEDEGMPGRQYKRGLAPYVFVPWEHIQDSPLNLPVAKMDFYVPG